MFNRHDFLNFCKAHKSKRFSIEVRVLQPNKSKGLRGYYFAEVVPKMRLCLKQSGYNLTLDQTHDFIKQFSPVMNDEIEIDGVLYPRSRSFKDPDFTDEMFREYIADLQRLAAEEFSVIINDPISNE